MVSDTVLAKVKVLADDTVRLADKMMREDVRLNHTTIFVLYVGNDELNAIRYVAGERYYRDAKGELFCGCELVGVKRDTHFHLTVKP